MVSVLGFKRFMGYTVESQPATPAIGVLTVTREDQSSVNVIPIPAQTIFSINTKSFETIEQAEINESQKFIPLSVRAVISGADGNIEAGQTWNTPIAGIVATNANAFSNGADAINESSSWKVFGEQRDEGELEQSLNTGIAGIKRKLALENNELLDNPEVDRAVYLLSMFYFQNNNIQEKNISLGSGDDVKITNNSYYRGNVFKAVQKEIDNLIAPYRNVLAFMPSINGAS